MSKLFNLLAFLIFPATVCLCQNPNVTIAGQIVGYNGKLQVKYAISPYPNSFSSDSIQPDSEGRFVINKFITATHFFNIYYSQDSIVHTCRLILRPNNYYKFVSKGYLQDDNNPNTYYSPEIFSLKYRVEGSPYLETDAGQVDFNLIDNGTMGILYHDEWDLSNPESLIDTLQARIARQQSVFKRLLEMEKIDSGFYMLANLNIQYFNAYKLAQSISDTWFSKDYAISDSVIKKELYEVYPRIFGLYPVKGVTMEWLWGFQRYVGLYLCFREDYKNGVLIPRVRKDSEYMKTMETSNVIMLDTANQITSIQQLLNILKGRPALIDCWATWCPPCIGQFQFADDLKPFLRKHEIQMVYIAIQLDDNRQKWENYIKQFGLSGYHLIASEKLKQQLKDLYSGYISLPTYMIVNAEGKILVNNAAFPSDGNKLHGQLIDVLKL